MSAIVKQDIIDAASRIAPYAHRTPVLSSTTLNKIIGSEVWFKCENFQKVGAFKFRGATNTILQIPSEKLTKGVATHSSGNHAQALALAAATLGISAYIVMPNNAPNSKKAAVQGYGAKIIECEATLEARESTLAQVIEETGAYFIHPYNDERIIAGQATAAKELIQEAPNLDAIIAPVGGGGLLSGTALSAYYFSNGTKVYGAEPTGADDAHRSFRAGEIIPSLNPDTIADGLLTSLGTKTFPLIQKYVQDILTVSDKQTVEAMKLIWQRLKIIVEPSAAVALAVVTENQELFKGKKIGVILSGGNVDLDKLPF